MLANYQPTLVANNIAAAFRNNPVKDLLKLMELAHNTSVSSLFKSPSNIVLSTTILQSLQKVARICTSSSRSLDTGLRKPQFTFCIVLYTISAKMFGVRVACCRSHLKLSLKHFLLVLLSSSRISPIGRIMFGLVWVFAIAPEKTQIKLANCYRTLLLDWFIVF